MHCAITVCACLDLFSLLSHFDRLRGKKNQALYDLRCSSAAAGKNIPMPGVLDFAYWRHLSVQRRPPHLRRLLQPDVRASQMSNMPGNSSWSTDQVQDSRAGNLFLKQLLILSRTLRLADFSHPIKLWSTLIYHVNTLIRVA